MISIKKGTLKIEMPNDSFTSLQDTYDGMYFRMKDGTEIRFNMPVTTQMKAISNIIMKATAENIMIDFDAKNIISLSGTSSKSPVAPVVKSVPTPVQPVNALK